MADTFGARSTLQVGDRTYTIYRLDALEKAGTPIATLPVSLKILLENLLRREDGLSVTADDIRALAAHSAGAGEQREVAFMPARVILQDFTGVPCVVDLAAMRDAMVELGGDPQKVNPLLPVELVIDHSVQVDVAGSPDSMTANTSLEYKRNAERYALLKWAQGAFSNLRVVPPSTGIVHQVNLEYLARGVFATDGPEPTAYPDTVVGTDSHTTMINGLGVLGWGVGGIEAEAAMLGQAITMLIPPVVGFRLSGSLPEGATATDLVLTITQMLRKHGVVGKFVEFHGPGIAALSLADRATIANMAPEYGATCGIFPVDDETIHFLRETGRPAQQVALVEAYMKAQGMFRTDAAPEANYTERLELDLDTVEPCVAGPKRPQDRTLLRDARQSFTDALPGLLPAGGSLDLPGSAPLGHGAVVIAAITSCTNTSNPSVMVAAGLVARKAVEKGLKPHSWVKASLAPGSRVVTEYLHAAGLDTYLDAVGFNTVGYGCTTCIGNSGPLAEEVSRTISDHKLVVCSVLSGNRNFEGRVHQEVRANYLMSPPLVVAYALAGTMDLDITSEPIGNGADGEPVYLRDLWPSSAELKAALAGCMSSDLYSRSYATVFDGDSQWQQVAAGGGSRFGWDPNSTYVKRPPYFDGMASQAAGGIDDIQGARVLAILGDSVTTDHISPAGNIKADSPAGRWLKGHGVAQADFNTYGSRRGHDHVMVRGTFANVRIRNRLAPGTEGGFTTYLPTGEVLPIYDAAERYSSDGTPTVIVAGKEYGSGSSRDWAAKGPYLQGVRAVIAESFERIHRSNLIGMGIVPLEMPRGTTVDTLGIAGSETIRIEGLDRIVEGNRTATVVATAPDGSRQAFDARIRIDTPMEVEYFRHGGILQYVLRGLAAD